MANTVTLLSYANTFGDWVVTTNKLAQEQNDWATNNYIKQAGTLYLNSPTLGLQVANNAVIQGQFQVSGIGSSAYIQKNLQVDGSIISTGNNYIIANDNNPAVSITQAGSGLTLKIAGQTGTAIDASGNVYIGSAITGPFKLNVANGNVNFTNSLVVGSNITAPIIRTTNHLISKDVTASANILADTIEANTNLFSPTLAVSGTSYLNFVQANSSVITQSLNVLTSAIANNIQANTFINAPSVTGSTIVIGDVVSGNTRVISPTIIGTTSVVGGIVSGNTYVSSPLVVGGTNVIGNVVSGNTRIISPTVIGTTSVVGGNVFGNTYVSAPVVTGSNNVIGDVVSGNTRIISPTIIGTNVIGSIVSGNTRVITPTVIGTTSVVGGNVFGNTYVSAPVVTGSNNVIGDVVSGNTRIISPTIIGTNLIGDVVSGNTRIISPTIIGTSNVIGDNITGNTYISSPTTVGSNNVIGGIVSGNTRVITPTVIGTTNVIGDVVSGNTRVITPTIIGTSNVIGDVVSGNTRIVSPTIIGTNVIGDNVSGNTRVITPTVIGTTNIIGGNVFGNTYVSAPVVTGSNNVIGGIVSGNTRVITPTVIGTTSVVGGIITANTYVNAPTIIGTSNIIGDVVSGNTRVISPTIIGTSNIITSQIIANTSVTAPIIAANNKIDANTASLYIDSVKANTISVQGDFVINGTTVYNSDTLTINSNAVTPQNGYLVSARGANNSNAIIRWNDSQSYWDIRDVNNPTSYSQILTANLISDAINSTSSSTITSSKAANIIVNYFQGVSDTQNTTIAAGNTYARMASYTANAAWIGANTANTNIIAGNNFSWMASWTANSAWTSANAGVTLATAAYGKANAEGTINSTQNTAIAAGNNFSWMASYTANAAWIGANTANTNVASVNTLATAAYGKANAEGTINSTQNTWITNTNTLATAAYATANLKFNTAGGTITGNVIIQNDLVVQGNLSVIGNSTIITSTQLNIGDSLINLANNNIINDVVDIGVVARYNPGTGNASTGIFRDSNLKEWILFQGYTPEIASNNSINIADPSFAYANLYTNITKSNVIANYVTVNGLDVDNTMTNAWNSANDGVILATAAYGKANAEGTINSTQNTWITNTDTLARAAYGRANNSSNSFVGTTGTATPTTGAISFSSNNGVTVYGSSNILNISTPQDLRTSASPTFAGLTLTTPLQPSQGGTGATSTAGALTALLPTGTTAGYVLATGGPGNFYWTAQTGGGGGATPGTTINSTRLSYVANATPIVTFTTPTFSQGTQLRAYINGVRQFESEYSANISNSTISFTTAPTNGDAVLIEVDGYINNPYYANNIAFTSPQGGIVASANTIQLAINDLESRKATIASPSFTGYPLAPTAANNVSNTQIATTEYVNNKANSGVTFTASVTGSAGSVANTGITGIITGSQLGTTSNVQFRSIGVGTAPSGNTGEILATNNITAYYSDERLKTKLGNIENALYKVSKLNGFYYEANEVAQKLGYEVKKEVGVSAQEVEKVLPEIIAPAPIDNKYLTVRYEKLIPLLIEAIKELKQEIDRLKGDNK